MGLSLSYYEVNPLEHFITSDLYMKIFDFKNRFYALGRVNRLNGLKFPFSIE